MKHANGGIRTMPDNIGEVFPGWNLHTDPSLAPGHVKVFSGSLSYMFRIEGEHATFVACVPARRCTRTRDGTDHRHPPTT